VHRAMFAVAKQPDGAARARRSTSPSSSATVDPRPSAAATTTSVRAETGRGDRTRPEVHPSSTPRVDVDDEGGLHWAVVRSSSCHMGMLGDPAPGLAPRVGPEESVKRTSAPSWTRIHALDGCHGVFAYQHPCEAVPRGNARKSSPAAKSAPRRTSRTSGGIPCGERGRLGPSRNTAVALWNRCPGASSA